MTETALALRWEFPWMTYHPWILKGIVCELSGMELNDPENSLKLLHSESQNRWVSELYGNYPISGMPWEVSEFSLVRILCCSSPGSSVHGILQVRILESLWFPLPGNLPHSGIQPGSPIWKVDSLLSELPGQGSLVIHIRCNLHCSIKTVAENDFFFFFSVVSSQI